MQVTGFYFFGSWGVRFTAFFLALKRFASVCVKNDGIGQVQGLFNMGQVQDLFNMGQVQGLFNMANLSLCPI